MKIARRSVQIEKFIGDNLWRVNIEDINGYTVYCPFKTLKEANRFAEEWIEDEVDRHERKTWEAKWIELSIAEDERNGLTPILD